MSATPLLVTERLELWRPLSTDLQGLMAMVAPEVLRRHLGTMAPDVQNQFARLLRNAGSWSLYGYGSFTVRQRERSDVVGSCGVFHSWRGFGSGMDDTAEAGWIIAIDHWGRGLAEEAMRAVLDWFDRTHGPRRIACMIEEENTASHRLARKLGFDAYARQRLEDGAQVVLYERL